jgi:hypothetical protein
MNRRRTWKPDPGENYRLIVRCRGRRILGVGQGEPAPIIFLGNAAYAYALDGTRLALRGGHEWAPQRCECPNHHDGHRIDGSRLRNAINRLCPPGKIGTASIDVDHVELL